MEEFLQIAKKLALLTPVESEKKLQAISSISINLRIFGYIDNRIYAKQKVLVIERGAYAPIYTGEEHYLISDTNPAADRFVLDLNRRTFLQNIPQKSFESIYLHIGDVLTEFCEAIKNYLVDGGKLYIKYKGNYYQA